MSIVLKKLCRKILLFLAMLIIVAAVLSSVARALTPWLSQYREQFQDVLSKKIGASVTIDSLDVGWNWFQPMLSLNTVTVSDDQGKFASITLSKISLGLDILNSLWDWQIQPGLLIVDGMDLTVHKTEKGLISVAGLSNLNTVLSTKSMSIIPQDTLSWLLDQQVIYLKHINIKWVDEHGTVIPMTDLNVKFVSDGKQHHLKGDVRLEQTVLSRVYIIANFTGLAYEINAWKGQVYLAANKILLAQWLSGRQLNNLGIDSGELNFSAWLNFDKSQLDSSQMIFRVKNFDVYDSKSHSSKFIQKMSANLAWNRTQEGWHLTGDKIKLRLAGRNWPENKLSIEYKRRKNQMTYYLYYLNLASFLDFSSIFKLNLSSYLQRADKLELKGELWKNKLVTKKDQFDLFMSDMRRLSWNRWDHYPKVDGLSAKVYLQSEQGHLELDSKNLQLTQPELFSNVLKFSTVQGVFDWRHLNGQWRVIGDDLLMRNKEVTLNSQFKLHIPKKFTDAKIELASQFSLNRLMDYQHYLPRKIIKKKLLKWLDESILDGKNFSGHVELSGKLFKYPFDNGEGNLLIDSYINDLTLKFHHDWPVTEHIYAKLQFKNEGMFAMVDTANLAGIPVKNIAVKLPDFMHDKETLFVDGNFNTHFDQAKTYIDETPLKKHLSSLSKVNVTGPLAVKLSLEIPLYPGNDNNLITGDIVLDDNAIKLPEYWNILIDKTIGHIAFNQDGVTKGQLDGQIYHYPIRLNLSCTNSTEPATLIQSSGRMGIDALRKIFELPIFSVMRGMSQYRLNVRLPHDDNKNDQLTLSSNLSSLSIALPKPFGKKIGQKRSFNMKANFSDNSNTQIRIKYQNLLNAILEFKPHKTAKEKFRRGEIRLGAGQASLPKNDELRVIGSASYFSLSEWISALSPLIAQENSQNKSNFFNTLSYFNVNIKLAEIVGYSVKNINVVIKRLARHWDIRVKNPRIDGVVSVSDSISKGIKANFKQLHLSKNPTQNANRWELNPMDLIPLDIRVDDLRVGGFQLGRGVLEGVVKDSQYIFKKIALSSASYDVEAVANWEMKGQGSHSNTQGYIKSKNLAATLKEWHLSPVVESKRAELTFNFDWDDSPFKFALSTVTGKMHLKLKQGVINNLSRETEEKIGLGKLLSILSLQTLPRRLTLDFSDLAGKGFSFDIFQGNFKLHNGVLATKDSYIDGPVAYGSLHGSLNLIRKQYDMLLKISPHITASLPIVATIAGGPIAGIATWIASKIINQEMRRVTAYTYKVTGPWDQPVVQQLSITQKKHTPKKL